MNAKIWGRWLARLFKRGPARKPRRSRPLTRLGFEHLEDRLVPTTYTWTGLGGSSNWSVAANWQNGAAPTASSSGDLVFGTQGTTRLATVDNISGLSINSITFSAPGYSIGLASGTTAPTLVGGITADPSIPGTDTVALPMTLKPTAPGLQQTFSATAASTLDISGSLTGSESTQTINMSGAGTIELDGNNLAYTGAITTSTNSGVTLLVTNSTALGAANAGITTVTTGTQLDLSTAAAAGLNMAQKLILNGSGTSNNGALVNVAGNNTWSGSITLNAASMVSAEANTTLNVSGQIGDTGVQSITINNPTGYVSGVLGAGTVIFSRAGGNTYHGQTIIQNGVLEIEDPLSLGAGATFGSPESNTVGSETIVNFTSMTTAQGPPVVAEGTLELNFVNQTTSKAGATTGLGSGNTTGPTPGTDPNGILANPNEAWNATTNPYVGFQVFNDILQIEGGGYQNMGALYNAAGNNQWDGTLNIDNPALTNARHVVVKVAATTTLTVSGAMENTPPLQAQIASLWKTGGGTLLLNNANTLFYGNTTVVAGILAIADSEALGINTLNNNGQPNTPAVLPTATVDNGASLQLEVDSGYDGVVDTTMVNGVPQLATPEVNGVAVLAQTHFRNLGYDSVTGTGPGQELFIPSSSTTGTFTLNITAYNTKTDAATTYTSPSVNIASPTFANDLVSAVVNLLQQAGYSQASVGNVSVVQDIAGGGTGGPGNVYRVLFSGSLLSSGGFGGGSPVDIPLMVPVASPASFAITAASVSGTTATITTASAVPGLAVGQQVTIAGITPTGSTTGIGYNGTVTVASVTGNQFTYTVVKGLAAPILSNATVTLATPVVDDNAIYGLTVSNPLNDTGNGVTTSGGAASSGARYASGALDSVSGLNTYAGQISINGAVASIGAQADPRPGHFLGDSSYLADDYSLMVTGNIGGGTGTTLDKLGGGDMILPNANTYTGPNSIEQGWVTVQNDLSLGTPQTTALGQLDQTVQSYTSVDSGAAVMLDAPAPAFTGEQPPYLTLSNNFVLAGTGLPSVGADGALYGVLPQGGAIQNISGNNLLTGIVQLEGVQTVTIPAGTSGNFTLTFNGSATKTLNVADPNLADDMANALNALGSIGGIGLSVTVVQQSTGVYAVQFSGGPVSTKLAATNGVGVAWESPGIGVEQVFENATPATAVVPSSQLTLVGPLWNYSGGNSYLPGAPSTLIAGGITKLGSRRLVIQGPGTYTGTVNFEAGVVLVQNSTGLGAGNPSSPPTVSVGPGAALELGNTVPVVDTTSTTGQTIYTTTYNGGIEEGVQIAGLSLFLSGSGDPTFGDTPLTILSSNATTTGPDVQTVAMTQGGTFTLTYDGFTTPTITEGTASQAALAAIEADLDALAPIADSPGAFSTVTQAGNVYLITITNPSNPQWTVTATPVAPAGTGNSTFQENGFTEAGSTAELLAPANDGLVATDDMWEGPVGLDTNMTVSIPTNSRLIVTGAVGNGVNAPKNGFGGSGLTLTGGGELDLDGANTYSGTTFIDQGVLTAGNNEALGGGGVSEVQTVTITGVSSTPKTTPTTYTLTYTSLSGQVLAPMTFTYTGNTTADAAAIQNAFNAELAGTGGDGGGSVTVTESTAVINSVHEAIITITYGGSLTGFQQNLLGSTVLPPSPGSITVAETGVGEGGTVVANGASLQLAGSVTISGEPLLLQGNGSIDAVQTLTVPANATSGSFDLSLSAPDATGTTVTDTAVFNTATITPANVQANLNALGNVGGVGGSVSVVGEALETITVPLGATGTFTLSYNGSTTGLLNAASPTLAADIQTALNGLSSINGVGGSVTVTNTSAGVYTVSFGGSFASTTTQPATPGLFAVVAAGANPTTANIQAASGGVAYAITFQGALAGTELATMAVANAGVTGTLPSVTTTQVGDSAAQTIPSQWFQVGPATIANGQTTGSQPVAGTVTSIAVDPNDPNTIYIGTAGAGVWKTIDDGQHWYSIFNSLPTIESITVSTSGTFSLSFGSDSTGSLSGNDPNLGGDIQAALNGLGSIGGIGGIATVFESGSSATSTTFEISFGGSMAGYNEQTVQVTVGTTATPANIIETGAGSNSSSTFGSSFGLYIGAITVNPSFPNIIYVGTGDGDNSADSFYGTGIYESTNYGVTWSLLLNNTGTNPGVVANPFYGKVITSMQVDPDSIGNGSTGDLVVSDGDYSAAENETQIINSGGGFPGWGFTLSLTAPDATGAEVTDTTPQIFSLVQLEQDLDALSNIGGVGAFVTAQFNPYQEIVVTFQGALSKTTLPALVTDDPTPGNGTPSIGVTVTNGTLGWYHGGYGGLYAVGGAVDVNGATGIPGNTANSSPGIWVSDPNNGTWWNITSYVSQDRSSVNTPNKSDTIYGPGGTLGGANGSEPDTAGPDDNYQLFFPQSNATWSDVTISVSSTGQELMYAALGTPDIGQAETVEQVSGVEITSGFAENGVFWSSDFPNFKPFNGDPNAAPPQDVTWYSGNPWINGHVSPDSESASSLFGVINPAYMGYLTPEIAGDDGPPPEAGNIKISAVTGGTASGVLGPLEGYFGPGSNDGFDTIYASVSTAGGMLMGIYVSTDGGVSWASVPTQPPLYMTGEGQYDNSIMAQNVTLPNGTQETVLIVGGQVGSGNIAGQTGQIYESTDGGNTWTDLSNLINSAGTLEIGPHDFQHAIVFDPASGNVLFGNDGGIWQLNPNLAGNAAPTWQDINGDLPTAEINAVASDPTTLTGITNANQVTAVAAVAYNGTAGFSGTGWSEIDNTAGGEMGGSQVFIDPQDPSVIYTEQTELGTGVPTTAGNSIGSGAIIRESDDGGNTWTTILANTEDTFDEGPILGSSVPMQMDQINPFRLVVGGGDGAPGLYETGDATVAAIGGTVSWTNIGGKLPIDVTAIGLAEYQGAYQQNPGFLNVADQGANAYVPNTIYATDGTNVYVTMNDGHSWVEADNGLTSSITAANGSGVITQLVVDPRNSYTVYAVVNGFNQGQVYVTYNAGQSWTPIGGAVMLPNGTITASGNGLPNVPAWSLVVDPRNNNLYVGTDIGVFTMPGGAALPTANNPAPVPTASWVPFGVGLPSVQVHGLTLNPITNTLLAATYGEGVFEVFLTGAETSTTPISTSALTGLAGSNVWDGSVLLAGTTPVTLGAYGIQNLPEELNDGSINVVGSISDLTLGGNPGLDKVGGGDVVLSGANFYGGVTTVLQGNLVVDNYQALGLGSADADSAVVDIGAALEFESNLGPVPITLNGDGAPLDNHYTGALRNISGDNTFLGNIILGTTGLDNDNTVSIGAESGTMLTITGNVSGLASGESLVKEGLGTIALAGNDSYAGDTYLYGGGLQAQSPSAFSSGDVTAIDGAQVEVMSPQALIVQASSGSFTLGFGGDVSTPIAITGGDLTSSIIDALSALASISATGGTVNVVQIAAGVYAITFGGTLVGDDAANATVGNVSVPAGSSVAVGAYGLSIANTLSLSGSGLNAGILDTGALLNTGGNNTWSGAITLGVEPGFSPNTFPAAQVAIGAASGSTLTLAGPVGALTEGGATYDNGSQTVGTFPQQVGIDKVGGGSVVLQGADTFSGGVTVTAGDLIAANSAALGTHPTLDPNLATVQQIVVLSGDQTGTVTVSFDGKAVTMAYTKLGSAPSAQAVATTLDGLFSSEGYVGVNVEVVETPLETSSQSMTTGALTPPGGELYTITFGGKLVDTTVPLEASGTGGAFAAASFVTQGGEDVVVEYGAELDLSTADSLTPGVNLSFIGHTVTLNGSGLNGNGALQNTSGDNTWNGGIMIQTGAVSNDAASIAAASGSSLIIEDTGAAADEPITFTAHAPTTLALGGSGQAGGGSIIFPAATAFGGRLLITGGDVQVDSTGFASDPVVLAGGAVSGLGIVGPITNQFGSGGIVNPGDNADSVLTSTGLTFPSEFNGTNVAKTAASTALSTDGNLTLTATDAFDAFVGDPAVPPTAPNSSSMLVVDGNLTIDNAVLGGYVNPYYEVGDTPVTIIETTGGTILGTFANESSTTLGTQNGDYATTTTYIGNEQFVVEYFTTSVVIYRVAETVTISALTPVVPTGAPLTTSTTPPVNQLETVTISGIAGVGFSLSFNGQSTGSISFSPGVDQSQSIQNALDGLSTIGGIGGEVFVVLSSSTSTSSVYTVNFGGALSGAAEPLFGYTAGTGLSVSIQQPETGTVVYGEDVKAKVTFQTSSYVNLTGSSATFQIVTPNGTPYQYNVTLQPINLQQGSYEAILDLPESLGAALAVTTPNTPASPYIVSVYYDGTYSNGAQIFAGDAVADGTIINFPAAEVNPGLNVAVSPASTTTTLLTSTGAPAISPSIPAGGYAYGTSLTFTATVTSTLPAKDQPAGLTVVPPQGVVAFYDTPVGGSLTFLGTANLTTTGGVTTATFTTAALAEGIHNITAVYEPNSSPELYTGSSTTTNPDGEQPLHFTINQASTSTSLTVAPATINYDGQTTLTATVMSPGTAAPVGSVTFSIGGLLLATVQVSTTGPGTSSATYETLPFQIPADGGAAQTISASFAGNGNFTASVSPLTQGGITVDPIGTTVAVSSSLGGSSFAGQLVTFTAEVFPSTSVTGYPYAAPTGTVTFFVNGLAVATEGVSSANGLTTATYSSSSLPPGTISVTAVYNGDAQNAGNYLASATSPPTTVVVNPTNTQTSLTAVPTSVVANQAVTLTATVVATTGGVASGTVAFYDYGNASTTAKLLGAATLDSNGTGTIQVALGAPLGTHDIVADFLANTTAGFNASTSSIGSTVSPGNVGATPTPVTVVPNGTRTSSVSLTTSQTPTLLGNTITLTATVSDTGAGGGQTPTGTVTFVNITTGATLGVGTLSGSGGTATAAIAVAASSPAFKTGTDDIVATYGGSVTFAAKSSAQLPQVVDGTDASTITLTTNNANSTYDNAVTFTATIVGQTGTAVTGSVTFYFTNTATGASIQVTEPVVTTLTSGTTATYKTSTLPVGTYTVTANYSGSVNYLPEQSSPIGQTVNADAATVGITGPSSGVYGQALTYKATVAVTGVTGVSPTGTITFYDNISGAALATVPVTVKSGAATGTATWKTKTLAVDSYDVYAVFTSSTGNVATTSSMSNAKASLQAIALTVNPDTVKVKVKASTTNIFTPVTFTATVTAAAPGGGVPDGTVTFYLGSIFGTELGQATLNANGTASVYYPNGFPPGPQTIVVQYTDINDSNYATTTVSQTIDFTIGRGS